MNTRELLDKIIKRHPSKKERCPLAGVLNWDKTQNHTDLNYKRVVALNTNPTAKMFLCTANKLIAAFLPGFDLRLVRRRK